MKTAAWIIRQIGYAVVGTIALAALIFLLMGAAHCQVIPDEPQAQPSKCWRMTDDATGIHEVPIDCKTLPRYWDASLAKPTKPGLFTVRGVKRVDHKWYFDSSAPALRANWETLSSPTFYVPEATGWAATVLDVKLNGCKGTAPCGHELHVDAYVPAAFVSVSHYVFDRWVCRACSFIPITILIEKHTRGLVNGVYP